MNQPAQNIVREEPARFTVGDLIHLTPALTSLDLPHRIELIDGTLVELPFSQQLHGLWASRLTFALQTMFANSGPLVLAGAGLALAPDTVRRPDLLLVKGGVPGNAYVDPADVLLAAEVADTTLALDLGPRKLRFARAGVPHYWVVDVEGQRVHRFAEPRDGDYAAQEEQGFDAPLPVPGTDKVVQLG
jgi:Uma2 family endonuclease